MLIMSPSRQRRESNLGLVLRINFVHLHLHRCIEFEKMRTPSAQRKHVKQA